MYNIGSVLLFSGLAIGLLLKRANGPKYPRVAYYTMRNRCLPYFRASTSMQVCTYVSMFPGYIFSSRILNYNLNLNCLIVHFPASYYSYKHLHTTALCTYSTELYILRVYLKLNDFSCGSLLCIPCLDI